MLINDQLASNTSRVNNPHSAMDLAAACQQLADLDHRLEYGTDYSVDLQVVLNQLDCFTGSDRRLITFTGQDWRCMHGGP